MGVRDPDQVEVALVEKWEAILSGEENDIVSFKAKRREAAHSLIPPQEKAAVLKERSKGLSD